jgi:hypothetical protein
MSKHTPDTLLDCTVCGCEFDLEAEGGIQGDIGILPVAFCPTCCNGIRDMAEQLWPCPNCEEVTLETEKGDDGS